MSDAIIAHEDLLGIAQAIGERGLEIAIARWSELEPQAWEFLEANIAILQEEMRRSGLSAADTDRLAHQAMLVCLIQVLAHRAALDRLWMDSAHGTPLEKLLYEERDEDPAADGGKPSSHDTGSEDEKKKGK